MPGTQPVFDPRHDAIYQRGYRPGMPSTRTGRVPVPADVPVPDLDSAGRDGVGAVESAGEPSATDMLRQSLRDLRAEAGLTGVPLAELPLTELTGDALLPAPGRSVNPFIIALWALGPVLIVAGLWLQVQVAERSFAMNFTTEDGVPLELVLMQAMSAVIPGMMSAGILTMVGLLFWHAWRWRAARS